VAREYRDKKWNSLTDFKEWLDRTSTEKVLDFDGLSLTTDKGTYGLFDSHLLFIKKNEKK
jgi:hypothetical protein